MASTIKRSPRRAKLKKQRKENGWDAIGSNAPLPIYNPLNDKNLRSHFENKRVRKTLFEAGLIDQEGRILETERQKGKLFIIEQEFAQAEKEELRRQQFDDYERQRVEMKKIQKLLKLEKAAQAPKQSPKPRVKKPQGPNKMTAAPTAADDQGDPAINMSFADSSYQYSDSDDASDVADDTNGVGEQGAAKSEAKKKGEEADASESEKEDSGTEQSDKGESGESGDPSDDDNSGDDGSNDDNSEKSDDSDPESNESDADDDASSSKSDASSQSSSDSSSESESD
mmetsp:Transcript_99727/g.171769  ORF Transcript_99727/g.171769 Transcript_99727/m.171769 type:complete len:284 (-) Transcript_99727:219-1070(-)